MISKRLVQQIERNANKLAEDLVETMRNDRRASHYQNLTDEQYLGVVRDLYSNLGQWLQSRTWSRMQTIYEKKGRERYHGKIPLQELIFSLTKTKHLLLDFVRGAMVGDSEERVLEMELILSISEFFDRAIYHTIVGYEDARRALHDSSEIPVVKKPPAELRPSARVSRRIPIEESEISVSRSGDIGETGG